MAATTHEPQGILAAGAFSSAGRQPSSRTPTCGAARAPAVTRTRVDRQLNGRAGTTNFCGGLGWTDAGAELLADAIQVAHRHCEVGGGTIELPRSRNRFWPAGVAALRPAAGCGPTLEPKDFEPQADDCRHRAKLNLNQQLPADRSVLAPGTK